MFSPSAFPIIIIYWQHHHLHQDIDLSILLHRGYKSEQEKQMCGLCTLETYTSMLQISRVQTRKDSSRNYMLSTHYPRSIWLVRSMGCQIHQRHWKFKLIRSQEITTRRIFKKGLKMGGGKADVRAIRLLAREEWPIWGRRGLDASCRPGWATEISEQHPGTGTFSKIRKLVQIWSFEALALRGPFLHPSIQGPVEV